MNEDSEGRIIRVLYVVLFYLIYSISDIALLFIAVVQSVLSLFTGEPSRTLSEFGGSLGNYVKQISQYVSFNSNEKPFPFSDWPAPEKADDSIDSSA